MCGSLRRPESDFRTERKTKRRIKAAKFALRPTFEDFDFIASCRVFKMPRALFVSLR